MGELTVVKAPQAIDARRELIADPVVAENLNLAERDIMTASVSQPIKDMEQGEYIQAAGRLFRFIAIDTGYIIPRDRSTWQYLQTRLAEIVRKYYGHFSLKDIKTAFELLVTGGLNNYLPKDSAGNPDNKHYQQFNAEYFAKVLKAYESKRNDVVAKCYTIIEKRPQLPADENNAEIFVEKNKHVFENYKKTGKLEFYVGGELFVWEWLHAAGRVEGPKITPEERKTAARRITQKVRDGLLSPDRAYYIHCHQDESTEIGDIAYDIARRRDIKKAFDQMIKDNVTL